MTFCSIGNTPEDRLAWWRDIRQTCTTPEEIVSAFGNLIPERRYIDYYTPESWPGAFEIVAENALCQSGIAIVLANTLAHAGFINMKGVRFEVITSHIDNSMGLVLKHQGKYYNFVPGQIDSEEFVKDNGTVFSSHIVDLHN